MSKEVEKIVIHYKSKEKPHVITDGLALYTLNNDQDAEMQFVGINSKEKIKALLNAIGHSLTLVLNEFDHIEEIEKGLKERS